MLKVSVSIESKESEDSRMRFTGEYQSSSTQDLANANASSGSDVPIPSFADRRLSDPGGQATGRRALASVWAETS